MYPVLLGLLSLLGASPAPSGLHSPLSWSADGRWLAYTVATPATAAALEEGWLYDTEIESGEAVLAPATTPPGPVRYRLWAGERTSLRAVLIDDSPGPLTAPVWGPEGFGLVYGRFVPEGSVGSLTALRGRCEYVIQQALDRRRVVLSLPGIELDRDDVEHFAELRPAWTGDGRYLALPRPGKRPAVLVVLAEQGRLLKTLEGATLPAWSPDGARLAVVKSVPGAAQGARVEVTGHDFSSLRGLVPLGDLSSPPVWSTDGDSLLVAGWQRSHRVGQAIEEMAMLRLMADSGAAGSLISLASRSSNRAAANATGAPELGLENGEPDRPARVNLSFTRDQQVGVFSLDMEDEVPILGTLGLERPIIFKRFHPLDIAIRLGAVAILPEGREVAVRAETVRDLCPPLLCDPTAETVRVLLPDAATRSEWLATLVETAQELLELGLPRAAVDDRPVQRATLLPIPGEIPATNPLSFRLKRLGRLGRTLLDQPLGDPSSASASREAPAESADELRLFFDYLQEDYAAAEDDLRLVEGRPAPLDRRLRLVSLRAQILQGKGEKEAARDVAAYLVSAQERAPRLIEDTPAGFASSVTEDPSRGWPRYLADRLSGKLNESNTVAVEPEEDPLDELRRRLPAPPIRGNRLRFRGGFPRRGPGGAVAPGFIAPNGPGAFVPPNGPGGPFRLVVPPPPRPFRGIGPGRPQPGGLEFHRP
jgi:hypothetical protein